ncbi:MAG: alpha/beta hydrolase [Alphaproteobacteria bacterium]|nr:alpha/beta hydrolase [Alphaproteobacteria bacterium]
MLFLHGGYWQRRTREEFAWLAPPWLEAGCAVALVGYPLCPVVSIQSLVRDVVVGVACLWRRAPELGLSREWVVSGHSAGGHLAATLAATDWRGISSAIPSHMFKGCVTISGVFDLGPLLATSLNQALRLTREIAASLSPLHMQPPSALPAILAVGGAESQEFLRQTLDLACAWNHRGADAVQVILPNCNHFEALEALGRAGSPLFTGTLGLLRCDKGSAASKMRPIRRRR